MAAHNAASALVAGEVLQRIRVYQDPCKALQRLVTKDHMRTPQVRQSNANDRLRTPARVTYFRDIGLQSLPLPFSEHGNCVRPSVAAGIAGLAASASSVPASVSSAVLIFAAATPARRPTGPQCCPPRSVSAMARPQDPIQ
jgi:hypothetical protein